MHLRALHLHDFRLYQHATFEFSPAMNIVRGPNAKGKTSLLEAIYFLMTGRSFRTSQASDLIRHGAPFFHIEAIFNKHGIEQRLRVLYNGKERKVTYNGNPCPSSLNLLGLLQGTVIHPDDAAIVKGAPTARRHLLDLQLAQADPLYVHHLTRFAKAMRQRNYLLRARNNISIETWEYEMAHSASYIIHQRASVVKDLERHGQELYRLICGGKEELSLAYKAHGTGNQIPDNAAALTHLFRDQYQRHRPREMDLGATMTGPHKDDLIIALAKQDARGFASEGQQRSCVVALRLAEWERLKNLSSEIPLMLVDDLGVSLDAGRRLQLSEHLSGLGQVFLTTTEEMKALPGAHIIEM